MTRSMIVTDLETKAKDWILAQTVPDSLLGLIEFFDYELSDEEGIELYELILEAKVDVRWN